MPTLSRSRRASSYRDPANPWLVSEPNRIEKQYWKDLWRYRELFAILAWRDITFSAQIPRHMQTVIGVVWALIRPLLTQPKASAQQQVQFPRLIVPASAVITSFVDFLISFGILAWLMVWFGLYISLVGGLLQRDCAGKVQLLYALNPMVGVIEGFRWEITGVRQFRRMEKRFADVI